MRVNFSVSENEVLKYREMIDKGILKTPVLDKYVIEVELADGSTYAHKGQITFADTSFSQGTGTMLVRAEVANPQGVLMPASRARPDDRRHLPEGHPRSAKGVQQSGQGYFVWVVDPQNKAQPRPVEVGSWIGDQCWCWAV